MGVYIKGMEMPATCCHCPLMGYDPYREWFDSMARTGAHICVLTGELIDNTKREEHCPLAPVPPHGRLIDADEFRTEHRSLALLRKVGLRRFNWHIAAAAFVDDAPTIIPAEEGET